MKPLTDFCPRAPDFALDWQGLHESYEWIRAMQSCEQSPEWHAEGNVWIHTRMVLESLIENPEWRALSSPDRRTTFCACALHDVAKPQTSRLVDGRIRARGHSRQGAIQAREILWHQGTPIEERERVCHLILHHQVPFFLVDRSDADALALRISWTARADLLAIVAFADATGRVCDDKQRLLDNIELYRELCRELNCLTAPRLFGSDNQRVTYFRNPARHPDAPTAADNSCTVTLLAGLPASGKDTFAAQELPEQPVVSLDALRTELGIDPTDNQGIVAHTARERTRDHLRARRDFVFNATNLRLDQREPLLGLLLDYHARVEIVYLEAPPNALEDRNRRRPEPIPAGAIQRMLRRWHVPDLTEAHTVRWIDTR